MLGLSLICRSGPLTRGNNQVIIPNYLYRGPLICFPAVFLICGERQAALEDFCWERSLSIPPLELFPCECALLCPFVCPFCPFVCGVTKYIVVVSALSSTPTVRMPAIDPSGSQVLCSPWHWCRSIEVIS